MASYIDEYRQKFEEPYVAQRTVGFSGIDPAVSEDEIARAITEAMNAKKIVIDSGEIT